jgi:uracil-DNA glycosylase
VLSEEARACRVCAPELDHEPRPVFAAHARARVLIVGQAPGRRVHASGIPWDDASGERLREWMGVSRETFYDARRIAILPMGFCYPGTGSSGDLPPRPECAPLWMDRFLAALPDVRLTLLVGRYAQARFLDGETDLTRTVRQFRTHLRRRRLPIPHPSPRNNIWLAKHPFFERTVMPVLRRRVSAALR